MKTKKIVCLVICMLMLDDCFPCRWFSTSDSGNEEFNYRHAEYSSAHSCLCTISTIRFIKQGTSSCMIILKKQQQAWMISSSA